MSEHADGTSRFVVLIYEDERTWAQADEEQRAAYFRQHDEYSERAAEFGVTFVASEALQPVATASTLRPSGGRRAVTEGPYAETTEQLSGFYLLDAHSRADVLRHLEILPAHYVLEVREIMDL